MKIVRSISILKNNNPLFRIINLAPSETAQFSFNHNLYFGITKQLVREGKTMIRKVQFEELANLENYFKVPIRYKSVEDDNTDRIIVQLTKDSENKYKFSWSKPLF